MTLPYSFQAQGLLPPGLKREVETALAQARKFNEEVIAPICLELDQRIEADPDFVSEELARKLGDYRFFSAWIPKLMGGGGRTPFSMMPFNEELGTGCLGAANIVGAHFVAFSLLSATLNTRILKRISEEIIRGEIEGKPCLLSAAITEPAAGTDLEEPELLARARVKCLARRVEGGYRLSGNKVFISNARLARYHVVVGYTDLKNPGGTPVVLLVAAGSPGLSFGRTERKLGQHASTATELVFNDCFVPDELVAMGPDQYKDANDYSAHAALLIPDVLPSSRGGIGALATGAARSSLEKTIRHAKSEKLDGIPLCDHQWVQEKIARMRANVTLSRLAYWEASYVSALEGPHRQLYGPMRLLNLLPRKLLSAVFGRLLDSERTTENLRKARILDVSIRPHGVSAFGSLAKSVGSDLAMENNRLALEIMGTRALRHAEGLEKILRDSQLLQIFEGSSELNRVSSLKEFSATEHPEIRFFE